MVDNNLEGGYMADLIPLSSVWKIDGDAIPTPSHYGFGSADVQTHDSGRDTAATMNIKVVAFGKRSIEFSYDLLSQSQMAALLTHFHKPYYSLTYPDPEYGVRTIQCYIPERKSKLYTSVFYNGMWKDTEITAIER